MPPIPENSASRDRLVAVIEALSARPPADPAGAARALARLAFWDSWAEQLLHRWRSGQLPPPQVPDWYDEAVDNALAAQWAVLDLATAGRLALAAATALDRLVDKLESPVLAAVHAADQQHLVSRHTFRTEVLDAIPTDPS